MALQPPPLATQQGIDALAAARAARPGNDGDTRANRLGPGVGWTEADILSSIDPFSTPFGRRAAAEFLRKWQDENPTGGLELTHRRDIFDWMSYLAGHPDRTLIFNSSQRRIQHFRIARLDVVLDKLTKSARVDFLIGGDDGMVIRLHPDATKEAYPIIVPWAMAIPQLMAFGEHAAAPSLGSRASRWFSGDARILKGKASGRGGKGNTGKGDAAPSSPRGNDTHTETRMRSHFLGVSQTDLIPTKAVKNWAYRRMLALPPGSKFKLDVTSPVADDLYKPGIRFLWYLWFNTCRKLHEYVEDVEEVWMVKLTSGDAGFWFRVRNGDQFLVTFVDGCGPRGNVQVERGRGNFDKQIDWEY